MLQLGTRIKTRRLLLLSYGGYLYLAVALYCLWWAYFGRTSFVTTFIFYVTIALLANGILFLAMRFTSHRQQLYRNYQIFITTALFALFLLEALLKYGLKTNQVYFEKIGKPYNESEYRAILYHNYYKKHYCINSNCWLFTKRPMQTLPYGASEFKYTRKYNSLGLADVEPVTLAGCRDLFIGLGDSFTEGFGTHQDSTWLKCMEYQLNNIVKPDKKICTFNGGIGGSDVVYEYMLFKEVIKPLCPQLVLLAINPSDISDIIVRGGMERFKPNGIVQYRKSFYFDMLCQISVVFRSMVRLAGFNRPYYYTKKGYELETKKALEIIAQTVFEFNKLAQYNEFKLVVILHSYIDGYNNGKFQFEELYNKLSSDTSFITINLYEEMLNLPQINRQPDKMQTLFWPIDGHHNPEGYRFWGNIMAECLLDIGLLDQN